MTDDTLRDDLARFLQVGSRPKNDRRSPDQRDVDEMEGFAIFQRLAENALSLVRQRGLIVTPPDPAIDFAAWAASLDDAAALCERAAARETVPEVATAWRVMGAQWAMKSAFLHEVALCLSRSPAPARSLAEATP
jgi:hypothetical protein